MNARAPRRTGIRTTGRLHAQVLGHLLERCAGDLACALGSYNVGPNARKGRAAARYVAKIDLHLERLEQQTL